jgi:hypothetical protein
MTANEYVCEVCECVCHTLTIDGDQSVRPDKCPQCGWWNCMRLKTDELAEHLTNLAYDTYHLGVR